ncbi:interferon alpha/beta receptor 1 isoform X1 [Xenopus laevis]|uniref:Fibronectin type-III domain-containing protein n=2 Tax=Xenopus laevis TaxID=8355 RepID=A0A974DFU3_XENLA|nr:interferon alpha/beta receptor 1 isoform X1 [Xenopus laevis]OCT91254.1 hypothetical protein XELAEV_18014305mg [Xenopus laevis]
MAAEPGLLFLSQFCFLLFLPPWTGTLTSGLTYLEPPFNVKVHTLPDKYSVVWDWNNGNREDAKNVTFSVFVRKLKKKPSAQFWSSVPGCLHISHHNCSIDPALIDTDKDYKVQVRAEMSQIGSSSSDPVIFSAKVAGETAPPIAVRVEHIDGGVRIETILPKKQGDRYAAVLYYILFIGTNHSVEERKFFYPKFHLYDLTPGENYCFNVTVFGSITPTNGMFSPEKCFTVEALGLDGRPYPENVTIDALNTNYMLKWDWDDSLYPNVTFSVEMVAEGAFSDGWKQVNGCENISMLHCDVSSIYIFGTYNFRIAASFDNKNRTLSRALRFHPLQDTTIGPPSDMSTELLATMLQIKLLEPKAFHNNYLKNTCDWEYNLIYWKDSKSDREEKSVKEKLGRFAIEVESSTTYCMKACVECQDSKRRGLFSKKQCITTGAGARTVWSVGIGIGFLVSIVVSAVVVYLCACPFKRYIRHIFYPAGKLPSSIENGMLDSRVKIPFVFQEEEATDVCYIIRNSGLDEDHVQNHKYSLKESSADSGNYSNEDEATGEAYGRWPLHTDNVASSTAIHMDA